MDYPLEPKSKRQAATAAKLRRVVLPSPSRRIAKVVQSQSVIELGMDRTGHVIARFERVALGLRCVFWRVAKKEESFISMADIRRLKFRKEATASANSFKACRTEVGSSAHARLSHWMRNIALRMTQNSGVLPQEIERLLTGPDADERLETKRLLTKPDVAKYIGVTTRTLEIWMREGRIPFFRIRHTVRFRLEDVLEHLRAHNRVN